MFLRAYLEKCLRNIANKIDSLQIADSLNNSIIDDFREKSELDEMAIAELEQQIMNHLSNYSGNPKWTELSKDQQEDHYTILTELL